MASHLTPMERLFARIKRNPIVATLLFLGTIVMGLSAFTNAASHLLSVLRQPSRPAINGEWRAEVQYDWERSPRRETFRFQGTGDQVQGSASFLGIPRGIVQGEANNDQLRFAIKTQEVTGDWSQARERVHRYEAHLSGDSLRFVMQTEGGTGTATPITFVARKVPATANAKE